MDKYSWFAAGLLIGAVISFVVIILCAPNDMGQLATEICQSITHNNLSEGSLRGFGSFIIHPTIVCTNPNQSLPDYKYIEIIK